MARYILHSPGLAPFRWCRLSSNVRPRGEHLFMRLLAPSPALMNASLRTRREKQRSAAKNTKNKNAEHRFSILVRLICGGVRDGVKALRASSQIRSGAMASPAPESNHGRRCAPCASLRHSVGTSRKFKAVVVSSQAMATGRGHVQNQHAPARRGLTPPSSRAPTALALAGEALHVYHRPRRPSPSPSVPAYVER